jgi:hypothetical protein
MTLWERCDQIITLIDKTLSEVAVTPTAIPTISVGRSGRPRPQETSPLAQEGQPPLAPTGAALTAEVGPKLAQPDGQASPHEHVGYLQSKKGIVIKDDWKQHIGTIRCRDRRGRFGRGCPR